MLFLIRLILIPETGIGTLVHSGNLPTPKKGLPSLKMYFLLYLKNLSNDESEGYGVGTLDGG